MTTHLTTAATAASIHTTQGRAPLDQKAGLPAPSSRQVDDAQKTREAFAKFVGTTVFGQMLGSMRKTVGEPAYFHGGQAEKVFQGQLDQQIADEMTARGASPFAEAMFRQQFPDRADVLRRAERQATPTPLDQLNSLRRR
ncbi:MAG: rod-binding protein [Planctomycetota bacterium]